MKLLVVDDEVEILTNVVSILEHKGFQCVACSSGEEAIEVLKNSSFDLIITDKKMKKVSGIDILNHVENNCHEVPVFLLTGDASSRIDFSNPKSQLLRKPYPMLDLIAQIEKVQAAA